MARPGADWPEMGDRRRQGTVHAITGVRDIHVVPPDERTKTFPRESVFLDVGAKSAAEVAALGISPGDPVVPDAPFMELNGTRNYVGKAWDDRIGCAVLIEAMRRTAKQRHPNQLLFVATVQEEVGLRGAETAAAAVKPDVAIALEGGVVGDAPGSHPEEPRRSWAQVQACSSITPAPCPIAALSNWSRRPPVKT